MSEYPNPLDTDQNHQAAELFRGALSRPWQPPSVEELELPKFAAIELIAAGGMGAVYLATHKHLKKKVAIKVLPPSLIEDDEIRQRFIREGEALASLNHPNIVAVDDCDITSSGLPFLVMKYCGGGNLRALLKSEGKMSEACVEDIASQILAGLEHMHASGIVHRDIKPENILRADNGDIIIIDLGIAKLFGTSAEKLTLPTVSPGTPGYMAPEQLQESVEVDHRADLFAVAVIIQELLVGSVLAAPSEALPVRFKELISRGLNPDPASRFQSAAEMRDCLFGETQYPDIRIVEPAPDGGRLFGDSLTIGNLHLGHKAKIADLVRSFGAWDDTEKLKLKGGLITVYYWRALGILADSIDDIYIRRLNLRFDPESGEGYPGNVFVRGEEFDRSEPKEQLLRLGYHKFGSEGSPYSDCNNLTYSFVSAPFSWNLIRYQIADMQNWSAHKRANVAFSRDRRLAVGLYEKTNVFQYEPMTDQPEADTLRITFPEPNSLALGYFTLTDQSLETSSATISLKSIQSVELGDRHQLYSLGSAISAGVFVCLFWFVLALAIDRPLTGVWESVGLSLFTASMLIIPLIAFVLMKRHGEDFSKVLVLRTSGKKYRFGNDNGGELSALKEELSDRLG